MAVNKVVFGAVSIMDISDSTVTADKLMSGYTAYDKAGNKITGTASAGIDTSDATATAQNIESGKTAYVNGAKVTGTDTSKADLIDVIEGSLSEFVVPDGVTRIKRYLFSGVDTLERITIPYSVREIDDAAFQQASSLNYVRFSEGLKKVGTEAFFNCSSLVLGEYFEEDPGVEIGCILPESVERIEPGAFGNVTVGTQPLVFGSNIKYIGRIAFVGVYSLDGEGYDVIFKGTPTSIDADAFSDTDIVNIYVPWAEGAVANAPWGADNATIHYNSVV